MFKVLVCDDDAGLRLSVQAALSASGRFEVDEAFDGVNAVEKIKAKTYNIVLLDVDMPRMNGMANQDHQRTRSLDHRADAHRLRQHRRCRARR